MPAPAQSMINRSDFVLVVVDVQERLVAAMPERVRVLEVISRMLRAASVLGAPIIVTRQYPKGLGDTVPEIEAILLDLADHESTLIGVDKLAFDCAAESEFLTALRGTGRRQVVIVGMESHICVTQSALSLAGLNFQVHIAADGCCSRDVAAHRIAMHRLRSTGVIVTHSESVIYEAVGEAGTELFKAILHIVK